MKLPVVPPSTDAILQATIGQNMGFFNRVYAEFKEVDEQGRYLHWDKLRHLPPPEELSAEHWWLGIKLARQKNAKQLPLFDKQKRAFQFCTPSLVLASLHKLDRNAAGSIQASPLVVDPQTQNTYLIRSLMEEAINSSQLEGASTTQNVAKEMIRQNRAPRDRSEQMIFNNYQAMRFVREVKSEQLTPSIIFELQRILTHETLDKPDQAGRFRRDDEGIKVIDNASQVVLHEPPVAAELPERLQSLCDFANTESDNQTAHKIFLHPVIRAIALHFMLAYDHPFCDGNGRTARALFYWSMVKAGYWLTEFISISKIIKQSPIQYGKAFLYTESDDNDLTYFVIHQLDVVHKAIDELQNYLATKTHAIEQAKQMLVSNNRLQGQMNFRQLSLLRHALEHPRFFYVIEEHQRSHGVSYDVARKDLLAMADDLKLLVKTKEGKRFLFMVPDDLVQRLRK